MYSETEIKKFFIKETVEEARTPAGLIMQKYCYTYKFPVGTVSKTGVILDEVTIWMPEKDPDAAAKEAYKEYVKALAE